MNTKIQGIQKASLKEAIKEQIRVYKEYKVFDRVIKKDSTSIQKGDGHPVLFISGFKGGKKAVKFLIRLLTKIGYQADFISLEDYVDKATSIQKMRDKFEEIYQKTGKRISLIGWSLGGIYAREIAKKHTEKVRQVITLGSPFNGIDTPGNVIWLFSLVYGGIKLSPIDAVCKANLPQPANIPTTAIYSKNDGVVDWKTCVEKVEDEIHQNIEVDSTHQKIIFDKKVIPIILDRLCYQQENWEKYKFN